MLRSYHMYPTSDAVEGTTMITPAPIVIDVDQALLHHQHHLPEVQTCWCGYTRPTV